MSIWPCDGCGAAQSLVEKKQALAVKTQRESFPLGCSASSLVQEWEQSLRARGWRWADSLRPPGSKEGLWVPEHIKGLRGDGLSHLPVEVLYILKRIFEALVTS